MAVLARRVHFSPAFDSPATSLASIALCEHGRVVQSVRQGREFCPVLVDERFDLFGSQFDVGVLGLSRAGQRGGPAL